MDSPSAVPVISSEKGVQTPELNHTHQHDEMDIDNHVILEPTLPLYQKILKHFKEKTVCIKQFLVVVIICIILLGLIYNFFAKEEKDIPKEVFDQLYNLLGTSYGFPQLSPIEDFKAWEKIRIRNLTRS